MSLNIVFAGTPDFALPCLQALMDSLHTIQAVYTQPDRPAGRGQKITASPVKILALSKNIPVLQPRTWRDAAVQKQLSNFHADIMVVVAYGLLLPREVLAIPRYGCVNVHASLLPRWRGAAPIVHAILAGDSQTGITIMQMNEGLDTGDILTQTECDIFPKDTAGDLQKRLEPLGARLLLSTLEKIEHGKITPRQQEESQATFAAKVHKKDAELNWHMPAELLARRVRAFNPLPIVFTYFEQQPLRIWEAQAIPENSELKPGTIVRIYSDGIDVATSDGILRLLKIQLPGKKPQLVRDFIHAYYKEIILEKTVLGKN